MDVTTVLVADAEGRLVYRVDAFDPMWPSALQDLRRQ